jgi:segregation and condensation protein B
MPCNPNSTNRQPDPNMSENDLNLAPILEATLLASTLPLNTAQLYGIFGDTPPKPGAVEQALTELKAACEGRGVELVEVASGWRYQVRSEVHPYVARLWTERQSKYTRATLETLALIAYRQPITRGEIEQIRGVSVSATMIKSLEEREWIRVLGHRDVPGRPELFGTTKTFLDYFGLKSLDQLPPLAELKEYPELEPQLSFDISEPIPAQAAVVTEPSGDLPDETDHATPETEPSTESVETTTDPLQH